MTDGKISEIRNCPSSNEKYRSECLLLTCERALFDRGTIPAYAKIVASQSQVNFSDDPLRSRHVVKYPEQDKFRYVMCEMKGSRVVSVRELTAREQNW